MPLQDPEQRCHVAGNIVDDLTPRQRAVEKIASQFRTGHDRHHRQGPRAADSAADHRGPITYYGLGSNKRKWAKADVDARIHDMRRTTGMRVLRATGNLKAVQKILGHTDIAITARFYTDATLEDQRAAMEATAKASATPPAIEPKKKADE
jgi:integrase